VEEIQAAEVELAAEQAASALLAQLITQLTEYRALLEKDASELKTKATRIEELDRTRVPKNLDSTKSVTDRLLPFFREINCKSSITS